MLEDIEQFVPPDFASLEEMHRVFSAVGETAAAKFEPSSAEAEAIAQERATFAQHVASLDDQALAAVEPVAYRRVLGQSETRALWNPFQAVWGRWYGGVSDRKDLPPYMTLQAHLIDDRLRRLGTLVSERGARRLFEIREWGPCFEVDIELVGFEYTAAEGFWFERDPQWMICASHEDSLTIGGEQLVNEIQRAWPDWKELLYRGWDGKGPAVM